MLTRARVGAAVVVGVLVFSLGLAAPSWALLEGSSISTGNLAAAGFTAEEMAGIIGSSGGAAALTGASAAAPVAAVTETAAASAAGAGTSVWGAVTGKVALLLAGVAPWVFTAPDAGEPGLPPGSSSGTSTVLAGAYTTTQGFSLPTAGVATKVTWTYTRTGAATSRSVWCGVGLSNGAVGTGLQSTSVTFPYASYVWSQTITGQSASVTPTGIRCFVHPNSGQSITGVALPTSAAALANFAPAGWGLEAQQGTFVGYESAPKRHVEQTVTCKAPNGTTSTVVNSSADVVWSPGEVVEVAGLMCPEGLRAVGHRSRVVTENGEDLTVTDSPSIADDATSDVPAECYASATAACVLRLQRATGTGEWVTVDPQDYPDWWDDIARDRMYRCQYGMGETWQLVGLNQCTILDKDGTGPKPPVVTEPDPSTDDCSFGWSDLLTGGILIRGGMCLVEWATVPDPAVVDQVTADLRGAWDDTALATMGDAMGNVAGAFQAPEAGGCEGPGLALSWLPVPQWEHVEVHPLDACSGFGAQAAAWVRPVATVSVWGAALMSAWVMLAGSFGLSQD